MVVNANFLLTEDPTRRAVICFSIENTSMRIWIFTRAGVTVSEPLIISRNAFLLCVAGVSLVVKVLLVFLSLFPHP